MQRDYLRSCMVPAILAEAQVTVALVCIAALLVADFGYVMWRARHEWRRGDEISKTTGLFISSLYLLVGSLLVVALVEHPWPIGIPPAAALVIGGALVAAGIVLAATGFVPFGSIGQLYGVERGGLITDGIYRYSRNPQYTGIGIALLGSAILGRSGLALAVLAAYCVGIRVWLVVEEAHLQRAFGAQYTAYRKRAPRFLGRPAGR